MYNPEFRDLFKANVVSTYEGDGSDANPKRTVYYLFDDSFNFLGKVDTHLDPLVKVKLVTPKIDESLYVKDKKEDIKINLEKIDYDKIAQAGVEDAIHDQAVNLGRLGGKKGGPARAKILSSEKKIEIAKKAADARWSKESTVVKYKYCSNSFCFYYDHNIPLHLREKIVKNNDLDYCSNECLIEFKEHENDNFFK